MDILKTFTLVVVKEAPQIEITICSRNESGI